MTFTSLFQRYLKRMTKRTTTAAAAAEVKTRISLCSPLKNNVKAAIGSGFTLSLHSSSSSSSSSSSYLSLSLQLLRPQRLFSCAASSPGGHTHTHTHNNNHATTHSTTGTAASNTHTGRTTAKRNTLLDLRNLSSLPMDYVDNDDNDDDNDGLKEHERRRNDSTEYWSSSPSHLSYVSSISYPITSKLHIVKPEDDTPTGIWPVYRIMDENGRFRKSKYDGYHNDNNKVQQKKEVSSNNRTTFPFVIERNRTTTSTPRSNEQPSITNEYKSNYNYNDCSNSNSSMKKNAIHQDIHQLKLKLINNYPDHTEALQSSLLFQNKTLTKSYAETFSSLTDHQNSKSKDKNSILLRTHRIMTRLRQMDDLLLNAQRQGRVSFYLTCRGEEGIHIGSASALSMDDVVLMQYREQGIFMWRGFTLDQFTNQCMTNDLDLGRGRQMPIHYGSRALNIHTISSPLGTQLPHAVGVAYKKKLNKLGGGERDGISIVYFGDGAASTTDFHSALNFAATLKVPMIFFCRNNGYAISTKITEQYASDGIISRCKGYGMAGIRVDGNDIFAVHAATKAAREYAIENSEPVLIEAISYRQGHHSTSDDSSQYRPVEEVSECECVYDPLKRLEKFLVEQNWIDESEILSIEKEERMAVLEALQKSEKRSKPSIETMFQDVYSEMPLNLVMQEKSLQRHMKKYPSKYRQ